MVNFQFIDASQRLPIHGQDEPEEDPSEQSVLWDMTRHMETFGISPYFTNQNGDFTNEMVTSTTTHLGFRQ